MKLNKNTIDMIVLVLALMLMMLVGGCVNIGHGELYKPVLDENKNPVFETKRHWFFFEKEHQKLYIHAQYRYGEFGTKGSEKKFTDNSFSVETKDVADHVDDWMREAASLGGKALDRFGVGGGTI